jgi:hypothetical protein
MSAAFFVIDAQRWPRTLARLRQLGPLDEDDARMDLRYLENEHRVFLLGKGGGAQFPGRTELMKRWDWTDRAVRSLLAAEDWQDPNRPVAKEQLRQSFKGARKGEVEACPMTRQWPANDPPMTAPANADNPPIVSNERPMAVQSMSIARASSEPRSTTEPQTTQERAADPGPTPKLDPALTLWSVLRGYQPRRDPTPNAPALKAMRRMLAECGGLDQAGIYLAWAHHAQDRWAQRLRGEAPWPDGDTVRRMDPESLARSIGGRMEQAMAWESGGRRDKPQAPPGRAPPHPTRGTLASELFADDPDPAPRPNAINTTWSEA